MFSTFCVEFKPRDGKGQAHRFQEFGPANIVFQAIASRIDIEDAALYVESDKERFCFVTKEGLERMRASQASPLVRAQ